MNDDELAAALESGNPAGGPAEDLRALLADGDTWAEPDPAGLDALLASIAAESGAGGRPGPPGPRLDPVAEAGPPAAPTPVAPAPAPAPLPGPAPSPGVPAHIRRDGRTRAGRPRRALVLAAAAALVVLAGVAGAIVATRGGDPAGTEVAIAGTDLAPGASATARVEETGSGLDITLDVSDLPPAEPGTYYQGWVRNADGEAVTIGTFHMRGGDDEVDLWAGVELEDYPTLTVTLQQEGGGPESSGQVVLAGEIG